MSHALPPFQHSKGRRLQFYLDHARRTNDLHGLGAFLIMNEEWNTSVSSFHLQPGAGK